MTDDGDGDGGVDGAARKALLRSEARARSMLEHGSEVISIHDRDATMLYQSPSVERVLGYAPSELVGQGLFDYIHPDDLATVRRHVEAIHQSPGVPISFETRFRHRMGEWRWFECTGTNLFAEPAIAGVLFNARDITDSKRSAEALRESRDELAVILKTIADGIIVSDGMGKIIYANDAAARILRYDSVESLVSTTPLEVFDRFVVTDEHGAPLEPAALPGARVLAGESYAEAVVRWHDKRAGTDGFSIVRATPVYDELRRVRYAVNVFHDITSLKQAQRAVHDLAAVVEAAEDAIVARTLDGVVLSWNPGAERLYGYAAREIVGKPAARLVASQHHAENERALDRARRGERVPAFETTRQHRDGTSIPVSVTMAPICDDTGAPVAIAEVAHDIRPQRRLEAQFRHAQKLEAVGRLAAGVAHDFNNILSVILSHAELAARDVVEMHSVHTDLEEITAAACRAGQLTRQLLAVSRNQVVQPRVLDLRGIVAGMRAMLVRLLGEDIEVVVSVPDVLGRVVADPGQLEQVLMNLAINARDAMRKRGRRPIDLVGPGWDATDERVRGRLPPGSYVVLSVTDTGVGMDAATRDRIFEPFFTTKPTGKGTGLGLATVQSIVEQSHGHIMVDSEPGAGTTFRVFLPRTERLEEPARGDELHAELHGSETILLVEDEDQVRSVAFTILRRHGYKVLEASNAGEALLVSRDFAGTIDLLMTDVIMPRMSGAALAQELARQRPEMRILFTSGYTDDAIVHHGVLDDGVAFLQKPFTPDSLLRTVRETLS